MENRIWGNITLQEDEIHYITLGDVHAWMKYRDEEVWIAHGHHGELNEPLDKKNPPPGMEWARWAHKKASNEIKIQPVFPDLPLIVHSEYMLKVSPGTRIQIYTRIPVWIKISLARTDYHLIEFPAVTLSRTWFGSPVEGELCYHATTKARRDLSEADKKNHVVSCPILISNRSDEELNFENFCYRVDRLSMYEQRDELWADETQVIYQGEDLNSDIIMTGKLPEGIEKKQLLSKPRRQIHKSLATRTFKRIFEDSPIFGR